MLRLNNITKTYVTGDLTQKALDGISIAFCKSEFVSVLGQSGSGKTTLLNIIGSLDQYTSGDLIINGRSAREYNDADWDTCLLLGTYAVSQDSRLRSLST